MMPPRLKTWAHASRVQSDEVTYDIERAVVGSVGAGATADCCGQRGACDRVVVDVAVGYRKAADMEMTLLEQWDKDSHIAGSYHHNKIRRALAIAQAVEERTVGKEGTIREILDRADELLKVEHG